MAWPILFTILSVIIINYVYCLSDYTYSFTLSDTNSNNILSIYSISVIIYVKYQSNGLAQFKSNVYDLSVFHFSMYINDENCGSLLRSCVFHLEQGESINIKIVKIDQENELLSFTYIDPTKEPQINAGKCPVNLPETILNNCVAASQDHLINDKKYRSKLCICTGVVSTCPLTKQDSCISDEQWWNSYNMSTPMATTSTTIIPSTTFAPTEQPTLRNLTNTTIDINNVGQILNATLSYSVLGSSLNSTQISEISTILYNSASVPGLSSNDSVIILENLDNLLNVNEVNMYQSEGSSQRLLAMLPQMVHNTKDERIDYLGGYNLGFTSKQIDCTNLDRDDGLSDLGFVFELINSTEKQQDNSIVIPLMDLCSTQELTHVFYTIYRQKTIFVGQQNYNTYGRRLTPIWQRTTKTRMKEYDTINSSQSPVPSACSRQTSVTDSPVMSATILNNGVMLRQNDDAIMAVVQFNTSQIQNPLHGEFKVTWWDVERSEWAINRQCTIISEKDGIVTAKCLHLTDFALIVDAALNDPNVCDTALMDLGYVVNSISIVALIFLSVISISTYSRRLSNHRFFKFFQNQILTRRDFIALIYHIDLLLFYFLFTIFSNQETSGSLCTTFAALMYTLLLCSILLTIFQGIRNILNFLTPTWFRVCSILLSPPSIITLSVVIPFLISIFLLVFSNFFDRQDCFCWVRPDYVIFAVAIPVTILIFNTLFCTALIVYKVFFGMKLKLGSKQGHCHHDPNVITKILSIIVMQISLGMPWIIQFGTLYSPYTTFWHYLFTIVLGSQGTTLLVLFFYKKYRIRVYESEQRSSSRLPQTIRKRVITSEEVLDDSE